MIDKQSKVPTSAPGTDETCRNLFPAEIAGAGGTAPAAHPATIYLTITLNNTLISG